MADIDGLRQRIELIDLRLKTAHSARERESAALMEMWEQIRDRFQDQNADIVKLRQRIVALEDVRSDLQKMVNSLLGAVENGLERMSDETVPQIRDMARGLLGSEIDGDSDASSTPRDQIGDLEAAFPADEFDADNDFLTVLENSMDGPDSEEEAKIGAAHEPYPSRDFTEDKPVSSGIRDLIARVEDSVGQRIASEDDALPAEFEPQAPDGLTRDLLEIEQLRNELLGLRERVSHKGA